MECFFPVFTNTNNLDVKANSFKKAKLNFYPISHPDIQRLMIRSGGSFLYKGIRRVIGAILSIKGRPYIATASHIFHAGGVGSRVHVEGIEGVVTRFLEDFDVALIELPPSCLVEITELGSGAEMEYALLVNEQHSIPCRVTRSSASLHFLLFPCFNMPMPGDSGSPILQGGKVIGLLSSVILSNCTGTAVSSEVLRSLGI